VNTDFFSGTSKPVLLAAALLLAIFVLWSQNLVDYPTLALGAIAVIVIAFFVNPEWVDAAERDSKKRERGESGLLRANDKQILEIPEEHEEELHHTPAGH
jgi:hypothetical protein